MSALGRVAKCRGRFSRNAVTPSRASAERPTYSERVTRPASPSPQPDSRNYRIAAERVDLVLLHLQPFGEHFRAMLAEQRRRRDRRRLAAEADRPSAHDVVPSRGMFHGLADATILERLIGGQLRRVEHGARWDG